MAEVWLICYCCGTGEQIGKLRSLSLEVVEFWGGGGLEGTLQFPRLVLHLEILVSCCWGEN